MNEQTSRQLPQWGWVLAAVFFPSGVFIAFGVARILSWSRAILFALLSYGCIIGFVQFMRHLEHGGTNYMAKAVAVPSGIAIIVIWGFVLYRIGQQANYWSSVAQRGWRLAGWFAVAVLCLACARVSIEFVVALRHG